MTQIQHRRGTAAEWTTANPVLPAGELALETDTGKIKFGNGSNNWNALPYFDAGAVGDSNANRTLGYNDYGPATVDAIQITSTVPTYIGGGVKGIANFSVDFIAPVSGRVRITADAYLKMETSVNEYAGFAIAMGGIVPPESKKLIYRKGNTLTTDTPENRVRYSHVLTDLVPGSSYTATLCAYINSTGSFWINNGGAFGPTSIWAEAESASVRPFGTNSTQVIAPTAIVSDAKYNSFPGLIKCPNGDLLGMYRQGTNHTTGSGGLRSIRSTNNGTTWGASATAITVAGKDLGTATLSLVNGSTIALTTWTRPSAGGLPDVNATRIYLSTNNGVSWTSTYTVTMPSGYLGKYSVSESGLALYGGFYYLAVWGEAAGSPTGSYQAGILRSTDLTSWTLVNDFGVGWNECGVTVIDGKLVGFARAETGLVLATTVSTNGTTWTDLRQVRNDGVAAPKFATIGTSGFAYNPLRIGAPGGYGYLAAADSNGQVVRVAHLGLNNSFMYGQAVETNPGEIGVFFAAETSSTDCRIYYASYDMGL